MAEDLERRQPKKEEHLVLKAAKSDSSRDESDISYLTQRFQKMVRRNDGVPNKGSSSRNCKGNVCCHKCEKPGHFIKECPLHKQDYYRNNSEKAAKRNQVPGKKLNRRDVADNNSIASSSFLGRLLQ
ncbi:uncharacterized protein LOC132639264 [Lycium barbarum]|uniref:uncharacterized protein LOC132639264 n=1 Tax=Lycium barbarum TaxID=112863 RepID=UPI00293F24AA|nr:uncharacterized protein LOC132639264 [Lycium barbarum]